MVVKTRIAPSPSGIIHIGNMRTAIWNYLFTKNNNGQLILRIDDTDVQRSNEEFILEIKKAFKFLNIKYDQEFKQSEHSDRYQEAINDLLLKGFAYKCFLTDQELNEMKAYNMQNKVKKRSKWRDAKVEDLKVKNGSYVIRLRIDQNKDYIVNDQLQGKIFFKGSEVDDFIIARKDGSATYYLASAVDDIDMGITHIIRGDDHLTNTPKTVAIYEAFKVLVPIFVHVPLVYDDQGKKMSKRNKLSGLNNYYYDYLPRAVFSYLSLLGNCMNHGKVDQYIVNEEDFDISKLGLSAVRFDINQLNNFNKYYIQMEQDLLNILMNNGILDGINIMENEIQDVKEAINLIKDRCMLLSDFKKYIPMYIKSMKFNEYEEVDQVFFENMDSIIKIILDLSGGEKELFKSLKVFASEHGIHIKLIMEGLRVIFTGKKESPNILQLIIFLGIDVCKKRISDWQNQNRV